MPDIPDDVNFQALFESAPTPYLVLTPTLKIVAASDAYIRATNTTRANILGRHLFDVFPDNPEDPAATGIRNLSASLNWVLKHHMPHTMAVQKYDIRQSENESANFEERHWSPVNSPVFNDRGELIYILHRVEDVTDFVHARDQALEASRFKSEFLANISHEIRTPMNGILGMTEIVLRKSLTGEQREHVMIIREAGQSLLAVINDVLDFSKIEAGKLALESVNYEPIKLVESVAELLAEQARQKNVSLVTFIDPNIPQTLRGDPVRLRQILVNLVGNAIKFSDHGEVTVNATMEDQDTDSIGLGFAVTDQGIGLSDDETSRLFKPFTQADNAVARKYGGTGLGLSISKRLVELMEGKISVQSKIDEGSTFTFSVPQQRCRKLAERPALNFDLRSTRVMVVDDEPYSRDALRRYLEAWHMTASCASGGQQALTQLRAAAAEGKPYQVVLIDLAMPMMQGTDLARAIQEDPALAVTKLILLTSFDRPGMGQEAIGLGFDAYITKPVRQSQLLDCLASVLQGSQRISKGAQPPLVFAERCDRLPQSSLKRNELILVVEDHPVNQQVALLLLHHLGFEAHVADNGQAAVNILGLAPYSLILMDLQMPIMDGLEATRAIRSSEAETGRHIPIIAMTAHAIEGSRESCLAAGMDDYLSKPIDPKVLEALVDKWLPTPDLEPQDEEQPTPAQETLTGPPIDLECLAKQYGADNAPDLVAIFVESTPADLKTLRLASDAGDCQAMIKSVHGLKGASTSLFAHKMGDVCRDLETTLRSDGISDGVVSKVVQIESEFQRIVTYLRTVPVKDSANIKS